MTELTRQQTSDAVGDLGWRLVLGALCSTVRVPSLAEGARLVARLEDDGMLWADLRPDRVVLTLPEARTAGGVGLAARISAAVRESGLVTEPGPVQLLEIAIDALDIPAIRPFWKSALGYVDETPGGALLDPHGRGPAVWFQQMDAPRPQRNRIHLDISVPHDEATERIRAALDAGGTLRSDAEAPAFWVLADAEGNEACVTTWQGRDP
ncbi:VOC family protein [Amycolatopsis sp. GM8]|uniref:VOC family protein n=1 Tax=Amycolatopsis sp. GM8 TaxID=2896530 RepID=UPI001F4605F9|nr:VOC family protein [Amycolatopsis sp. GM8]